MEIAVVGSGYVGLVTGACLAQIGHKVTCIDINVEKINKLKKGLTPIYEPGLELMLKDLIKKKRISFSSSIKSGTKDAVAIFIAVGTPSKSNGEADLTYVENVAREIAENMHSYKLLVEKSTVPAETGYRIRRTVQMNLPKKYRKAGGSSSFNFDVASNPEFLREGSAIEDFMHPDRVVVGVESKKAEEIFREIYKPLKPRMIFTDLKSAELIKHASNSFLATKISFINSIAQVCDRVGADVLKVAEGMGYDKRIGRAFLDAGIGYGGSCFPKDVDAFVHLSHKSGYDFILLEAVRKVNEVQRRAFVRMIEDKLWIVKNKTIAVWGLSFKPNTDDMRSAAALDIIQTLQKEGANIKAFDPQAMVNAQELLPGVTMVKDMYCAVKGAHCLLALTEWAEFKTADFKKVYNLMQQPLIFDGRNMFAGHNLEKFGFEYYGIGRGLSK
ncbi:MAG: UDP-glucose/GDP-mannose dehydrogenase family protein [Candidatus Omnitrophica bacterium]|nr:UDP-glucose/GDP-mannose dehydrogenase family protein [Candidatus Omnitrophota bacterium]